MTLFHIRSNVERFMCSCVKYGKIKTCNKWLTKTLKSEILPDDIKLLINYLAIKLKNGKKEKRTKL